MIKIENLIRIMAIITVLPLWIIVMYEGLINRGFEALEWI
tara:strand:- start:49 stop:168 length:120 start_codon:yes stop_codon:yes gene_type:complete